MKTLKDYKKVRHTQFEIDSAYDWGQGWTNNEEADRFHTEFPELFKEAGWNVGVSKDCDTWNTVTKGESCLLLFPRNFHGFCEDVHFEEAIHLIYKADTVSLKCAYRCGCVYVVDDVDDEMHLYHIAYDEVMERRMKDATTTKRGLYKCRSEVEDYLYEKVFISTSIERYSNRGCGTGYRYAASWIDKFINEGWIKVADDGKLIRWANKKEQKALEKK